MSASVFDSGLYRGLFGDAEISALLSDTAELRAMMLVLGTLAKVQGAAGVIPETAAAFLHRATMEVQVDPGALAASVAANGVSVPGLVAALRKELQAPEHAQYLHWGATSQDIQDTALMLRLRQVLVLVEGRMRTVLRGLADLAEAHAETPQAARTYGQIAVPSSFGAMVAVWGMPYLRLLERLEQMRARVLCVSLSGAAGTGSMLGPDPGAIRAALAVGMGLGDPGDSWHAGRDRIAELAGWLADLAQAGGKMGEDLVRLTRSGMGEVRLPGSGASSTMPQKENPVMPSVLVALARFALAQEAAVKGLHGEARDGAAWFGEWLALPGLVAAAGRSIGVVAEIAPGLAPDRAAMARGLDDPLGLIHAETLSFALARGMPREKAQAVVKALATEARTRGTPLPGLVAAAHPWLILPDLAPPASLGAAPTEARAFVAKVRALA